MEFRDYSTRYRPGLSLVLKDVSFSVKPGEKVSDPDVELKVKVMLYSGRAGRGQNFSNQ